MLALLLRLPHIFLGVFWVALLAFSAPLTAQTVSASGIEFNKLAVTRGDSWGPVAGEALACAIKNNGHVKCWNTYNADSIIPSPVGTFTHLVAGQYYICGLHTEGNIACWHSSPESIPHLQPRSTFKFKSLVMGDWHVCGLDVKGRVICSGEYASLTTPYQENEQLTDHVYTQIGASAYQTCGIRKSGAVYCWGMKNDENATSISSLQYPPPSLKYTQVAVAIKFACGLLNNPEKTIKCWGERQEEIEADKPLEPVAAIAAKAHYICALLVSGKIKCWGLREYKYQSPPDDNYTYKQITMARGDGACAIRMDGAVRCWTAWDAVPQSPVSGVFTDVAGLEGNSHLCARWANGAVTCWNHRGRRPPGDLVAHESHTCQINRDNGSPIPSLDCWGDTTFNQGTTPGGDFRSIAMGRDHNCGIQSGGYLRCWGRNDYEQSWGRDDDEQPLPPRGKFARVAVAASYSCGIRYMPFLRLPGLGEVKCWGDNRYGQTQVPTDSDGNPIRWNALALGATHACGINGKKERSLGRRGRGDIVCWGQPGAHLQSPVGTFYQIVVAGNEPYYCALTDAGKVACWGASPFFLNATPPDPNDSRSFVSLNATDTFVCALDTQGYAACWGSMITTPPNIQFQSIAVGGADACGITLSGQLRCWGSGAVAAQAPTRGIYLEVALGDAHGCALKPDYVPVCWGDNSRGQIGKIGITSPAADSPAITQWKIGTLQTIAWDSSGGIGDVRVQISRNNGQTWRTLVGRTPNDGVWSWKVSGGATSSAIIRVQGVSNGVQGQSTVFSIVR